MAMAKPWNPMEDDYKNKNFNRYTQGPGADLDDNLQPGAMAASGKTRNNDKREDRIQLCLKNVPADMSEKALWNLCSNYGKVVEVRRTAKTPYVFVAFATLNDMERALEGLRNEKPQGIEADIAKHTASNLAQSKTQLNSGERKKERERYSDSGSSCLPDMSKRDSKETTEKLKKLHMASKGSYNAEKDEFVKEAPQFDHVLEQIQYCSLCKNLADKVCQRCGDYYCSLECQRKDWARHRLFCFPMPELVAPVHITPSIAGSHSSTPSLNDSFETKVNKSKNTNPHQDNRNDEHRQQNQQQRTFDFKKSPNEFGDKNRPRGENRQSNNRPGSVINAESNNQENRKNYMNQNQNRNQREAGRDAGFDNKKDYGRKSDSDDRTTISSYVGKKDGGKPFTNNKSQTELTDANAGQAKSDESTKNKEPVKTEEPKKKPEPPIQIIRADYPKSGSIVAITSVIRPNKVFIRSMASEDNIEYVKTMNKINNEAKQAKTMTKMPQRSDLAITDFQGEGYYRVCVLNPESEDKILVAYVDFGNVDFKKLSELKEITPELISLKRQALTLVLKDVEDFEPTDTVKEYMNSFVDAVGKDLKLMYDEKSEKGPLVGTLIEVSTNENFNKNINELRVIKPAKLADEPVFSKDIKFKVLPPGENVSLIVLDTSLVQTGAISCVLESDLGEIDRMTQLFAEYVGKTKGPYTPRPQEICLVQYDDGNWYRAECIEVVGDQNPSVLFTDFGNLTTAHIDKIRKYPKELITPCVTITCLLEGIPEQISTALADRLKELIPVNEKIIVDKVGVVDDQTNSINLYQVVKALKDEKLI